MKVKLDRIISIATLVASLIAIILVLKRPAPVVQPPASAAVNSRGEYSDQQPVPAPSASQQASPTWTQTPSPATSPSQQPVTLAPQTNSPAASNAKPGANPASDAVGGMIARMLGGGGSGLSLDSNVGSGGPNIKDQQVTMDGDVVHGKFLTEIGGKDVWVTISGHMGEKDGYATFDPTEIKVGDMEIPVALVNPALQKKMAEERDRLKIPNAGSTQ